MEEKYDSLLRCCFCVTDCSPQSLYALMWEWCSSKIIYKITKRAQYSRCRTQHSDSEVSSLCFHISLHFSLFCQDYLKYSWVFNLSLLLSLALLNTHTHTHTHTHIHLVSWLQQGLKRLQFISTHSGWRPYLVAAGNSISLPHTDEWVTTFRAPVNMCLLW